MDQPHTPSARECSGTFAAVLLGILACLFSVLSGTSFGTGTMTSGAAFCVTVPQDDKPINRAECIEAYEDLSTESQDLLIDLAEAQ